MIGGKVSVEKGNKTIKETHDLWEKDRTKKERMMGKSRSMRTKE